jgi:O-antigen/teichoic acid export membrane protein
MLIARTLLYLPAQVVGPLSQFVAAAVWTYFLAPDALGTYAIIWAVQELALLVVLSWWSAYVLRYSTRFASVADRQVLDGIEIGVQVIAAMLQTAIALAVIWIVLDVPPSNNLMAAAVAFTLTRNLTSHFADRARARFATVAYTVLQSTGSLLGLIVGVIAVTYVEASPEAVLWSYAAAQAFGLAIALPLIGLTRLKPAVDRGVLVAAWSYGAPLMIGNALTWIGTHAIRFIVEADLGPAAVGLVSVGWWLGLRATTFAGLLVTGVAFNMAVERIREEGHRAALPLVATNGAMLLAVLVPTVVGVWMLNGALVDVLVAAPYREMTSAILPLAVATGAIRIFRMHGTDQTFLLFEKPKLDVLVSALDATATVVLCFVGLKLGGVIGAVWGCFAAAVLTAIVSAAVARMRFGYYLRLGDVARILLAAALMASALWLMPWQGSRVGVVVEVVVAGGLFLCSLVAMFPAARAMAQRRLNLAPRG